VAEQNRDGQVEALLRQELPGALVDRLRSVRHFNGVPIDAEVISDPVLAGELSVGPGAAREVATTSPASVG
jgi:2-oxoglutarate ferredoxin oxidoreductase subunit alpha